MYEYLIRIKDVQFYLIKMFVLL